MRLPLSRWLRLTLPRRLRLTWLRVKLRLCLPLPFSQAICFEGIVAGAYATETGNEVSRPTLEFTSLVV